MRKINKHLHISSSRFREDYSVIEKVHLIVSCAALNFSFSVRSPNCSCWLSCTVLFISFLAAKFRERVQHNYILQTSANISHYGFRRRGELSPSVFRKEFGFFNFSINERYQFCCVSDGYWVKYNSLSI